MCSLSQEKKYTENNRQAKTLLGEAKTSPEQPIASSKSSTPESLLICIIYIIQINVNEILIVVSQTS